MSGIIHGYVNMGVKGEVKLVLRDLMGRPVYESPWQGNLIVDNGLINIGTNNDFISYAAVGSNSTAASNGQTGLISPLGIQNTNAAAGDGGTGLPTYSWWFTHQHRFNAGTATGTIREVGMFPGFTAAQTNTDMTARIVVADIVKNADQVLDVYYKFTHYPDMNLTVTNNINIQEDGGDVFYDVTTRGVNYDSIQPSNTRRIHGTYQYGWIQCFDGTLAGSTVEDGINGNVSGGYPNYILVDSYGSIVPVTDGAYVDAYVVATLDVANLGAGIRTFRMRHQMNYDVGHQFDDVIGGGTNLIPKDNTKELWLTFRTTWSRV